MNRLLSGLKFAFVNFGPLIVFYAVDHFYGLKPAILSSIVFAIIDVAYQKWAGQEITSFYWFSVIITVVFGCFDLYLKESIFFKYEAGVTSLIFGGYFWRGAMAKKNFMEEFAERSGKLPNPRPPGLSTYFRIITWFWVAYFVIKGVVYLLWARHSTVEEMLGVRAVVGNISMFAMILISSFGSRYIFRWMMKRGLIPLTEPEIDSGKH